MARLLVFICRFKVLVTDISRTSVSRRSVDLPVLQSSRTLSTHDRDQRAVHTIYSLLQRLLQGYHCGRTEAVFCISVHCCEFKVTTYCIAVVCNHNFLKTNYCNSRFTQCNAMFDNKCASRDLVTWPHRVRSQHEEKNNITECVPVKIECVYNSLQQVTRVGSEFILVDSECTSSQSEYLLVKGECSPITKNMCTPVQSECTPIESEFTLIGTDPHSKMRNVLVYIIKHDCVRNV